MRLRTAGVSSASPVAALRRRMIARRRILGEEKAVPAVGIHVGEALLERGRQVGSTEARVLDRSAIAFTVRRGSAAARSRPRRT